MARPRRAVAAASPRAADDARETWVPDEQVEQLRALVELAYIPEAAAELARRAPHSRWGILAEPGAVLFSGPPPADRVDWHVNDAARSLVIDRRRLAVRAEAVATGRDVQRLAQRWGLGWA